MLSFRGNAKEECRESRPEGMQGSSASLLGPSTLLCEANHTRIPKGYQVPTPECAPPSPAQRVPVHFLLVPWSREELTATPSAMLRPLGLEFLHSGLSSGKQTTLPFPNTRQVYCQVCGHFEAGCPTSEFYNRSHNCLPPCLLRTRSALQGYASLREHSANETMYSET